MKKITLIVKRFTLLLIFLSAMNIVGQQLKPDFISNNTQPFQRNSILFGNDPDTDQDGIIDSIDMDDDNDGIPDIFENTFAHLDADNDGIPNSLDLDSDNDGIPDIEEAGLKHLSDGQSKLSNARWIDLNGNGLHDAIETLIAAGTYVLPDTDNDGVYDYLDLDSDNDSIFDVDEAGEINGDGDSNGDGIGDGPDTDKDGILDVFDNADGFGTVQRPYAKSTNHTDTADYRKIKSDADGNFDIEQTLYSHLDANRDGMVDGNSDADQDGIIDTIDSDPTRPGSPRNISGKLFVEFDGRNDYGQTDQLLSSLPQSTMMGWIKINPQLRVSGTIMGQENFNISIKTGSGIQIAATANGANITYNSNVIPNRWYHVAAVYNAADPDEKLKLYINGRKEAVSNNNTLSQGLLSSTSGFTFGRNAATSTGFYNGAIDEIRVFNVALTDDMLQKMVYQEISQNGDAIRGEVIPKDIENLSWSSLLAYYRMDTFRNNAIGDYTSNVANTDASLSRTKIYNIKNIRQQLAPMPFVTTRTGAIESAVSQLNYVNGTDAFEYEWSIVKINHNVTLPYNQTSLGLFIDANAKVTLSNDNKLKNTWYLKLDGKIELKGKSQLIQTESSDLDPASTGFIEKSQQGQTNIYNYNYWSSPVGAISNLGNNNAYTVNAVLRDATNPENLKNINWLSTINGAPTSPLSLSSFWINKFQNLQTNGANWTAVGSNGTLRAGEGFTLKGGGAEGSLQDYTFVGKPNNGNVTIPIAAAHPNLCGNPYPSAINADQFIKDNITATSGALYFWENYTTNTTHYQQNHQGGYATRTLVGGVPPMSLEDADIFTPGNKTPGKYIPVGQAFLMMAGQNAGNIKFNNGQRAFVKESNTESNALFKGFETTTPESVFNNNEDTVAEETFSKIRLGFTSEGNYHRQLLLGFMNENATNGLDKGYDAKNIDTQPCDAYFTSGGENLVIQGVGHYNVDAVFPITVKSSRAGDVTFKVDGLENFEQDQHPFIYDNATQEYYAIGTESRTFNVAAGMTAGRFSLRFKTLALLETNRYNLERGIFVANDNQVLTVKNSVSGTDVETVTVFNILGQSVISHNVQSESQAKINIPVANLSSGTYIIKIHTTTGDISKKIIIR